MPLSPADTIYRDGEALMAKAKRLAASARHGLLDVLDQTAAATDWLHGPTSGENLPTDNAVTNAAQQLHELARVLATVEAMRRTWVHVAQHDNDRTLPPQED